MISVHIHLKILYVLWTLLCLVFTHNVQLLYLTGLVFTHNVQLLDNSQKDSNTKCTSGLLLDVDQIGFKCVVSFEKDNDTLPFVTFVIKEEFDPRYNHLLTLGLLSECVTGHNIADSVVNCKKINDTEFHITVLTKALSKYSGARVMGYFDTYDPDGTSVQLPQSYEPTAAFGTLSINGQIKSSDMFCNETIDKEELNLKFNCSSSAEPCVGEIYVDDSFVGTPIENGALYNGKVQNGEEVTVTIKYAACRLDGKYNTMTCRINAYIVSTHKIQLFDYSQEDSKTTCRSGVLLNVDQSGFRSVIQLDNSVGDYFCVKYEIKEEFQLRFEQLLTIDLAKQCKRGQVTGNTEFNCLNVSEKEYHITVLVKALREYSNATIRGFFYTDDPNSKRVQLPVVYEPTNATGQLIINGQDKPTDTPCDAIIDTSELNLEFKCISSAKPCVIEIHVDNSVEKMGENHVVLKRKTTKAEELYVTIKYAACRLDGENITINCRVNMTYSEKGDHHDTTTTSTDKTSTGTDKTSTGTTPIIGIVVGVAGGILTLIVGIGVVYKFSQCFGFIKPKPLINIEKKTDPESASADTTLLKKSQNNDDKTANVSDRPEDKVKPTTIESGVD